MDPVVLVVLGALAAAVVAVTALVATGRLAMTPMSETTTGRPPLDFPDEPSSTDVDGLRLGTSAWGYAPAEVDAALDERRDRLAEQERLLFERPQVDAAPRDPASTDSTGRTGPPDGAGESRRVHPDA
ncbi:hypothetical protein BCF74_10740 [Knoellia remsis]|jgi:hypothetical protein|uniref:DivIVA domain-containing protein n=1 Tax=Knoellia remsis TaxID=407159 RepID=A0A2T0UQT2_9MICO|nr:hypothetical protein [Knoellia remsis]PRY60254.1 hypothetical protein BCF74_10740 [Knoellia remsis]